jgi:hypothetical protein
MYSLDAGRPDPLVSVHGFDARFSTEDGAAVAVFDFDGVLCDPIEDRVYRLEEVPGEREILVAIAPRYGLDARIYDTPYLRHMLLQAILASKDELPARGPLFPLASELSAAGRPFFILTARSSVSAVKRMIGFLERHRLAPQEIFSVGRVAKGRQLSLVRKTISKLAPIIYFDDSPRHVKNSFAQDIHALETVPVVGQDDDAAAARRFWDGILVYDRGRRAA